MKYKFKGDGACVPGLPLEISEEEAGLLNSEQAQVLKDALASGVYIEIGVDPKPVRYSQRIKKSGVTDEGEST